MEEIGNTMATKPEMAPIAFWLNPTWARFIQELAHERGLHVYRLPGSRPVYAIGPGEGPSILGFEEAD